MGCIFIQYDLKYSCKTTERRKYQMKDGIKIVTIGGGSSYTPELMEGFIKRYQELPIREIWLVDVEDGQ